MIKSYIGIDGRVQVEPVSLVVSLWNKFLESEGGDDHGGKIFLNRKEFFGDFFENPYDAAQAASAGDYRWEDEYVYISEGYLMSFTQLEDETCPVDLNKIDISSLIFQLQELEKLQKLGKGYVDNIPRAIHDALQDV